MKPIKNSFAMLFIVFLFMYCQPTKEESTYPRQQLIHDLNMELIKIISEDGFSPPVASRIYAYVNIAAYEAATGNQAQSHLSTAWNGYQKAVGPSEFSGVNIPFSVLTAYTTTAKHFVYRDHLVDSLFLRFQDSLHLSVSTIKPAIAIGRKIAGNIISWANEDGYNQSRNAPKYVVKEGQTYWKPTQPTYGEALEPHWHSLRPFIIDSSSQFRIDIPLNFSEDPDSDFYKAALETYEMVKAAKEEDINIAVYWDCNPGPTIVNGHLMQVNKQNTPGGHWIGINKIACEARDLSLEESCKAYAMLAPAIADGFISAWDTKYFYEFVRPETFINQYIDPDWKPKLESPLFPEFTSAHSLISAVSAVVLTHLHGDNFQFVDDTNIYFNLPSKKFNSFWEAAEEAAYSRLLGGIHYKAACEAGLTQGRQLGNYALDKYQN